MNTKLYNQRLLDMETTLSARMAANRTRAAKNSLTRRMTLAMRA
jgi:hypothetical protein